MFDPDGTVYRCLFVAMQAAGLVLIRGMALVLQGMLFGFSSAVMGSVAARGLGWRGSGWRRHSHCVLCTINNAPFHLGFYHTDAFWQVLQHVNAAPLKRPQHETITISSKK